jgi:hypothetical protein
MVRLLPLFALLTACEIGTDKPTLVVGVDDKGNLGITLERGDDHVFGQVSATANGIDCGAPAITKGSEGIRFSEASSPATATFSIAMAQLGESVHVVVREGDDTFAVDMPELGAVRTPQLLTSIAAPIAPGDWIEATTGVASDHMSGGFEITLADGSSCTVQWSTKPGTGSVALELGAANDLQYDWWCGDYPAPGTVVHAKLSLDIDASARTTSCSGDDLTCEAATLPASHIDAPIAIRF